MRMDSFTINKINKFLFLLGISLTIFTSLRESYKLPVLRYFLQNDSLLSLYPILILSILIFRENIVKRKLNVYKPLFIFFIIYLFGSTLIAFHGISVFPYYEYGCYENLEGGILILFKLFHRMFPALEDVTVFKISYLGNAVYTTITGFICSFFVAYSIYLYAVDHKDVLNQFGIGVLIAFSLITFYEVFEISYFCGFDFGKKTMEVVNPLLYDVSSAHGWWPPLFPWAIRGTFQEPSYFCYWGTLIIPVFLFQAININKLYIVPLILLSFFIFASNSRTGMMLLCGTIIIYFIVYNYLNRDKRSLINSLFIVICVLFSLVSAIFFLSKTGISQETSGTKMIEKIEHYVDNTAGTLSKIDSRSNNSRYGLMYAKLKTGLQYPLCGVGDGLQGYYFINSLPEWTENNGEIAIWVDTQKEIGSLPPLGMPKLDYFTYLFASGGIVQLFITLMPLFVITFYLLGILFKSLRIGVKGLYLALLPLFISNVATIIAFGLFAGCLDINLLYYIDLGMISAYLSQNRIYTERLNRQL